MPHGTINPCRAMLAAACLVSGFGGCREASHAPAPAPLDTPNATLPEPMAEPAPAQTESSEPASPAPESPPEPPARVPRATLDAGARPTIVPPPHEPCAGKPCGEPCTLCPTGDSMCMETAIVKACDGTGRCRPAPVNCGNGRQPLPGLTPTNR
jgi:hypothetical protein